MKKIVFIILCIFLFQTTVSAEEQNANLPPLVFAKLIPKSTVFVNETSLTIFRVKISEEEDKGMKRGDVEYPINGVKVQVKYKDKMIIDETIVTIEGLARAWVTDMDKDQNLEISMWVQSGGSGGAGTLYFFEIQEDKLLKRKWSDRNARKVFKINFEGFNYHGHDRYIVSPENIILKYPLYNKGDCSACSSGGMAKLTIEYKSDQLNLGEICRLDNGTEDCYE